MADIALLAALALVPIATAGAGEPTLLLDPAERARVADRLERQRALAAAREHELFGVLAGDLGGEEREALEFLLAFLPLADLGEHDGAYYLRQVRAALAARRAMPWGRRVPAPLFLRWVLPVRVNNEDLDEARPALLAELGPRVDKLSPGEAALEVNHWCHEHVSYRPSDARTSAPLATLRTSWGRCGEESTLLVAALRAVAIPACQVYTPRWAHTDSNHAWVEVWVDGAWHYLGACEPEPALDLAWFREPVRRAMLVHGKAMGGAGDGDAEEAEPVRSTPWFDELNLLASYAPGLGRTVEVVDAAGRPVAGASVEFGLYNSAELFPLATLTTGADGRALLLTGRGDLRLWASKDGRVGQRRLGHDEALARVVLGPLDRSERVELLDLAPPPEPVPEPVAASAEEVAGNRRRLAEEDRLRQAHAATFAGPEASACLAAELGLEPAAVRSLLERSQGNWQEVAGFLRRTPARRRSWALGLLGTVSDKDLRDTTAAVFTDHLECGLGRAGGLGRADRELFVTAVLAPRIGNELLRPWRSYLERAFGRAFLARVRADPARAVAWTRERVRVDDEANWARVPMSPAAVHRLGVADRVGRDAFLVALCRTAGAPARLEPGTGAPQVHRGGRWQTVTWDGRPPAAPPEGTLALVGRGDTVPEYHVHFTLARFEDGRYRTLDLEDRPWTAFEQPFAVPAGDYALTTGSRQVDGSVLVRQHFFPLAAGELKTVPFELRAPAGGPPPLGPLALGAGLSSLAGGEALDGARLVGPKGAVLVWIGRSDEPTAHALRDLERLRGPFEQWGGGLVVALTDTGEGAEAAPAELARLAGQAVVAVDEGGRALARALAALGRPGGGRLPVILGANGKGEVVFLSEGYRIGAGEQVLRTIRRLGR